MGDAAVSTAGILVEAANFGTLANVTVNGVMFTGVDFDTSLPANLTIGYDSADNLDGRTGTSTGGAIDALSTEFSRDNGVSFHSATLTGLTTGQNYEVQFLASFSGLGRTTTFDDGAGRSIVQRTNNPHSFSTGLFTADASTQTVNMTASTGSQFLTAYQLRAVNDPPVFPPLLTIDRDTGSIMLAAQTATDILGYSIRSDLGALDQAGWTPITDNYDIASGPGDGSVDPDDAWTVLTAPGSNSDLSEAQLGGPGPEDGGTIPASTPIVLSSGGGWNQYHEEDVEMTILRPDGTSEDLFVEFVGNNGVPFAKGDFDFDGDIDADDHGIFAAGLHTDLSSLSIIEAYARGDLNEDLVSNVEDFLQFQVIYDDANGAGAFAALQAAAVPEPSSMLLLLLGTASIVRAAGNSRRSRMHLLCSSSSRSFFSAGLIAVASLFFAEAARAADITWSEIIVDTTDGDSSPGTGLGDMAVSTSGTLIEAANFGILNDFTVNGVLFNGVDFDTSLLTNLSIGYDSADNIPTFGNGGTTTGGVIDDVTASFGRDAGISSHDAMLTGLTIGQTMKCSLSPPSPT